MGWKWRHLLNFHNSLEGSNYQGNTARKAGLVFCWRLLTRNTFRCGPTYAEPVWCMERPVTLSNSSRKLGILRRRSSDDSDTSMASQARTKWVISDQGPWRTLWPGRSVTFLDEEKFRLKPWIPPPAPPLSFLLVFPLNFYASFQSHPKLTKLWDRNDRNGCHPMTHREAAVPLLLTHSPLSCLVFIARTVLNHNAKQSPIDQVPSEWPERSFGSFCLTHSPLSCLVFIARALLLGLKPQCQSITIDQIVKSKWPEWMPYNALVCLLFIVCGLHCTRAAWF